MNKKQLSLYAITDRSWLKAGENLEDAVREAILGGASIVQLREKQLDGTDLRLLAQRVQAVCREFSVPFIINDDVRLAVELQADGAHVGASDMAVAEARALLGPDKIIGATAKTVEQARAAEKAGADYLGSGAIFGTTTKKDAKPMSSELLREICESVKIPVVAIGGIEAGNISRLRGLPVAGAAVVSGIFAQENVFGAARQLRLRLWGKPVVHCITNTVTINDVANLLHAVGTSPIMSHDVHEVEEVQENADALLVNLGAIEDFAAMKLAYRKALEMGHPIVIDPVGAAGNVYRRKCLSELLTIGSPSCIRGNQSEILAIASGKNSARGLDGSAALSEETAEALARKLHCLIAATGETDILTDGRKTIRNSSGSSLLTAITGSGCMLSAMLAAEAAYAVGSSAAVSETHAKETALSGSSDLFPENAFNVNRLAEICLRYGRAAAEAEEKTRALQGGTMTFRQQLIDGISKRALQI